MTDENDGQELEKVSGYEVYLIIEALTFFRNYFFHGQHDPEVLEKMNDLARRLFGVQGLIEIPGNEIDLMPERSRRP